MCSIRVITVSCLLASASVQSLLPSLAANEKEKRPNIVLILADDLGYGDLACYGSTVNRTPHIDSLAAGGLRLTDFHSSGPMCSPTRAATLTGQYQQRFGRMFDTALGSKDRESGLPHAAVTVAELLKDQGYATACFGKWHLGYHPPWLPPDQGFDLFRGLASGDGDFHTHIDRSGNEDWWRNNEIEMVQGYTTDLLTQYSVDFIRDHRDQPFFLYVPHLAIHFPWQGPQDPPHRQKGLSWHDDKWGVIPNRANVHPHVKAMIESLDGGVGRILAALRQWKLQENTLVVFTSDNGGYLTYAGGFANISSNGPLRGQKTDLYEGGHRVPAIFYWPGKIRPAVTDQIAHSVDLLPTFVALAGVHPQKVQTDGVDLGPLLFSGKQLPERMLFWRARQLRAVRKGQWKLFMNGKTTELYDLRNDLGEQRNLASKSPALVQELADEWSRWNRDVNDSAAAYEQ